MKIDKWRKILKSQNVDVWDESKKAVSDWINEDFDSTAIQEKF